MIVDDLSADREFLVALLRHHGHRTFEAANGRDGLAAALAERPDLVISDMLMPVMDGYEFVTQLRLVPATSATPVLFYTAFYGEREARALAESMSAAYVLTKPADSAEVLRVVNRALTGESVAVPTPHTAIFKDVVREHLRLLTDQLAAETGDLNAANARLRALINIGLELASKRDSDELLQSVCVAARDLFGATYITLGISQRDRQHRAARPDLGRGFEPGATDAGWIKSGDAVSGFLRTIVGERGTRRGENAGGDPVSLQLPALHPPVSAFLAVPIASPARVHGWLCLVSNEGRIFTETDEHLVLALAGQVGRIYELEHEIVERKEAEASARRERDRAQHYLDTADIILLALDLDERITLINRKGCDVLGWTELELLGRDWPDACVPARHREAHRGIFRNIVGGDLSIVESLVVGKSGAERLIEWRNTLRRDETGQVVGTLSSGADVTERRALEGQYLQAQKMAAIGLLAGGVAHDFNTMLPAILGSCELLLADLDPADPRQADIAGIQKAGVSAAGLTRQLLAFSRKQIIEPALLDKNGILTGMESMLRRLIREDVEVVLRLSPGLGSVMGDRGQVEQIVMNLAVNARDAMPTGGRLLLETANVESTSTTCKDICAEPGGCDAQHQRHGHR